MEDHQKLEALLQLRFEHGFDFGRDCGHEKVGKQHDVGPLPRADWIGMGSCVLPNFFWTHPVKLLHIVEECWLMLVMSLSHIHTVAASIYSIT